MKQILHILKESDSSDAIRLIAEGGSPDREQIRVLLIQGAVGLKPDLNYPVHVLEEDLSAGGATSPLDKVDYSKMLEMILGADSVVTW
jgi:sulfur transfer complex TusBCD TusB component (DsrH family)